MSFETAHIIDSQPNLLHEIRLPFPPSITVSDFINKRELSSRIFRKSPNAFFIYRKVFTNYLTLLNYKLTMIDVSKLVSDHWKNESKQVKDAYVKIAKEIDAELKEKRKHDKKCPVVWKNDKKSKKQKRKSRKNFTNDNITTNNNNNNSLTKIKNTTVDDSTLKFQNFSTPVNETDQKTLRSFEEADSQSSSENSPNSISYSLIEFPVFFHEDCNFSNYGNSCESPSNKSEEENFVYNLSDQIYGIDGQIDSQGSDYNDFVNYDPNDNLFAIYSWV